MMEFLIRIYWSPMAPIYQTRTHVKSKDREGGTCMSQRGYLPIDYRYVTILNCKVRG